MVNSTGEREPTVPLHAGQKLIVLVVEDQPFLRVAAVDLVRDAGFEAIAAKDADQAILFLQARADIRIVFTDVEMPGSMNGIALAIAIRGRWPLIELIVTSGQRHVGAHELPARGVFFRKPYADDDVAAMLHRMAA